MHNPKKKPSRGVCQVCGRPVVAITYPDSGHVFTYAQGHTYENGKLKKVRCAEHHDGLQVNTRALNAPPSPEDVALAEKIRGTRNNNE